MVLADCFQCAAYPHPVVRLKCVIEVRDIDIASTQGCQFFGRNNTCTNPQLRTHAVLRVALEGRARYGEENQWRPLTPKLSGGRSPSA